MKRAPSTSPTKLRKDQSGEEDKEERPPTPPAEDDETSEAPTPPPPPPPAEDDETSEASYYSSDDSEYDTDDDKSVLSEFNGNENDKFVGGEDCIFYEEEVTLEQHFLGHNPGGAETLPKILDHLYDNLAKPLQDMGLLYAPRSTRETNRAWGINFLPSIKDHPTSRRSVAYFHFTLDKNGRSIFPYQRYLKYEEDELVDDPIIIIFEFDYAPKEALDLLDEVLSEIADIEGVSLNDTDLSSLSYEDVKTLHENGISIFPRLLLHSMKNDDVVKQYEEDNGPIIVEDVSEDDEEDDEECGDDEAVESVASNTSSERSADSSPQRLSRKKKQGRKRKSPKDCPPFDGNHFDGAGTIRGMRRAWHTNNVESSSQVDSERRDVHPQHPSMHAHEHLGCDMTEWDTKSFEEILRIKEKFLSLLTPEERKQLPDNVWRSMLSWPRDNEDSTFLEAAKVLIHKFILGLDVATGDEHNGNLEEVTEGRLQDSVTCTPPGGVYAKDSYKLDEHLKPAFERIEAFVEEVENEGGAVTLDANNLVMSKVKKTSMAKYLKSREWQCFFVALDLQAFRFKDKGDGKIRIILLHDPLCYMLYSGDGATEWTNIQKQATRAKTAELLYQVINCSEESDDDLRENRSFWGSLLAAFSMRVYLIENLHIHVYSASLVAKNMIIKDKNLFLQFYHGIPVSKLGRNHREKRDNRGSSSHSRNHHLSRQLLTCLTNERADAEVRDEIDRFMKMLFETTNAGDGPGSRIKKIERLYKKYGLDDGFYDELKERYRAAESEWSDLFDENNDSARAVQERSDDLDKSLEGGGDY